MARRRMRKWFVCGCFPPNVLSAVSAAQGGGFCRECKQFYGPGGVRGMRSETARPRAFLEKWSGFRLAIRVAERTERLVNKDYRIPATAAGELS